MVGLGRSAEERCEVGGEKGGGAPYGMFVDCCVPISYLLILLSIGLHVAEHEMSELGRRAMSE